MATVFATFDNEGELTNMIVIDEDIDLTKVIHWSEFSYAAPAISQDPANVEEALEFLAQVHAIDMKNGVTA